MDDALSRIRERVSQNRTARAEAIATAAREMALEPTRRDGIFIAGDRVFDTITGQEGVVVAVTSENLIVPTTQR